MPLPFTVTLPKYAQSEGVFAVALALSDQVDELRTARDRLDGRADFARVEMRRARDGKRWADMNRLQARMMHCRKASDRVHARYLAAYEASNNLNRLARIYG